MNLYRLTITEPLRTGQRKQRKHTAIVLAKSAGMVVRVFKANDSVYDTPDATYAVEPWGGPVVMWRTFETV